jgi:hypothetical protein
MPGSEEQLKILKLLQEGKLTAEGAMQQLENVPQPGSAQELGEPGSTPVGQAHWMRVEVLDPDSGKVKVNLRLALSQVGTGLKMGARFSSLEEEEGFARRLKKGEPGKILDQIDPDDGERIQVYLE